MAQGGSALFSVVIPSGNAQNLVPCVQAILKNEPDLDPKRIIIVEDGVRKELEPRLPQVTWLSGEKPFIFARNVNIGIRHANSDVVVLGDDGLLLTSRGFTELSKIYGVSSASIIGPVCNPNQGFFGFSRRVRPEPKMLAFICVSIPKKVQDAIGLLDERFVGYGYDDNDYCKRATEAGIPLWVYEGCTVNHATLRPTFRARTGWQDSMRFNQKIYEEKYQLPAQK